MGRPGSWMWAMQSWGCSARGPVTSLRDIMLGGQNKPTAPSKLGSERRQKRRRTDGGERVRGPQAAQGFFPWATRQAHPTATWILAPGTDFTKVAHRTLRNIFWVVSSHRLISVHWGRNKKLIEAMDPSYCPEEESSVLLDFLGHHGGLCHRPAAARPACWCCAAKTLGFHPSQMRAENEQALTDSEEGWTGNRRFKGKRRN